MAVFCLRRKHTANASEPAVRKKRMSEECTHDCSSCGAACSSRDAAPKHDAPNPNSSVKKVIGVVSGKGGVGKSMTSALLACAMARRGYHCGILDADITGPSIPKLFGIHGRAMADDKGCWPIQSRMGIDVMSINLLVENEEDPVVWRGPVIAGAVKQFWTDVVWKDVDFLFVDMPPGTGDVPLTVFQSLPVDGRAVENAADFQNIVGCHALTQGAQDRNTSSNTGFKQIDRLMLCRQFQQAASVGGHQLFIGCNDAFSRF